MKIGIAGLIDIDLLRTNLWDDYNDRQVYERLGSSASIVSHIVNELIDKGFDITVFTLSNSVKSLTVIKGNKLKINIIPWRLEHRGRDFFMTEIKELSSVMRSEPLDIIHAHWTYEFAVAALHSGKPSLITIHDWAPVIFKMILSDGIKKICSTGDRKLIKKEINTIFHWFVRLLMNIYTLLKGKHFTVNSLYLKNKLSVFGYKDLLIIPNALPERIFYRENKKVNIDLPEIISINNEFSKWKNVKSLFRAFRLIKNKISEVKLHLVGTGYEVNGDAYKWATENNLSEEVIFHGPKTYEEVNRILETIDLLIHSSLEESFGLVLIEAMAKKVPVIGGLNSGAVPWVLDYGKAGVLVDVTQPELIAEASVNLLENPSLWESFSSKGYNYALNEFSISKIVDKYLSEYRRIIDQDI